ncbi:MAG TPA: glycogen synthase [Acidimicrobiia bacterium]|nr:glycogen synthase [Acidimicrobiia bacterium]
MRVALLTREYPPEIYGGAGVHVEYLARELDHLLEVEVHCFGAPRESPLVAGAYRPWAEIESGSPHDAALRSMSVNLLMAAETGHADIVHSHTWYANFGGHLAKLVHGIPHVATTHSLEPLRPWKAEQLGGGYALSCFCEKTGLESADAVIAVSQAMRADVLACYPAIDPHRVVVIHNGVDTDEWRPHPETPELERLGIDPDRPSVVFVGRITRQKGIDHFLSAAADVDPAAQIILLPSAPDTPEIGREMRERAASLAATRGRVLWLEEVLPRPELMQVLTHATVFVCPSVYEPFGLVNVEAMACEAPVVASAIGGIPEVVADGETGLLVPVELTPEGAAGDPKRFEAGLADAINRLVAEPDLARRMGQAGRRRVVEKFSWSAVARRTVDLYATLTGKHPA